MPIEPSTRVTETQIIRREEGSTNKQKKKPSAKKEEQPRKHGAPGKVDIKI